MATITEDYVSFETAKLLKEKGFNEYCWKLYELGDCNIPVLLNGFELSDESGFWNNKYLELYKKEHCNINDICSAPTLQMAIKWLREIYNIHIVLSPNKKMNNQYSSIIFVDKEGELYPQPTDFFHGSYKETAEIAIKYCLENLI